MRSHAPFKPIVTKFCVWGRVGNVITDAKFYENRLRGFGVTGPPQTPFPILNVHRPYNSVSTTVLHCDCCLKRPRFACVIMIIIQYLYSAMKSEDTEPGSSTKVQ